MAWSSAELSSDELTYIALDAPIIASLAALGNLSTSRWVGSGGNFASSDLTDSTYPIRRAVDGQGHRVTQPTSAGAGRDLLFDFGASGIEFDWIGFVNHNLFSQTVTGVTIDVDNASDFATSSTISTGFDPSSDLSADTRFTLLDLDHTAANPRRYSAVRYVAIRFAGASVQPSIGEVVFGRRYQMLWEPNLDYSKYHRSSMVERFESVGGIITDYVSHNGRRALGVEFSPDTTARYALFTDWLTATSNGTRTFGWLDDPNSSPHDFVLMKDDRHDHPFPYVGPNERRIGIEAIEMAPFLSAEA